MTATEQAKYKAGDRLHFAPSPARAPFGTAIRAGAVIVTEVVDHGSPTPYSPRFTYVVRALDGSGMQGTDDRELSEPEPAPAAEIEPAAEPAPMAVFPRGEYTDVIYAARIDAVAAAARYRARGARVEMRDVWTVRVYGAEVDAAGALVEPEPAARSICRYCGLVVETGGDPDAGGAEWTSAAGPGLTGRRRECPKAPNPTAGPMPDHRPGVIARRPR